MKPDNSIQCLEWAPGAEGMSLVGDFSNFMNLFLSVIFSIKDGWNTESHPYKSVGFGRWSLEIPANSNGKCPIEHNSIVKVAVKKNGQFAHKLSPWANYVTCANDSIVFHQVFRNNH